MPKDGMIKYRFGTNDNINIVEEWIDIDDDGTCSMRISLKIVNIYHEVKFYTTKVNNDLILKVVIDSISKDFSFDIKTNKVSVLDFENVIEYIVESIISVYDQSMA